MKIRQMPVVISQQAHAITPGFLNAFMFTSSELTKQSMTYWELQLSSNTGRRKTLPAGEISSITVTPREKNEQEVYSLLENNPKFSSLLCIYKCGRQTQTEANNAFRIGKLSEIST